MPKAAVRLPPPHANLPIRPSDLPLKLFLRNPEIWGKPPLSSGRSMAWHFGGYESWAGQPFGIEGVKEVP